MQTVQLAYGEAILVLAPPAATPTVENPMSAAWTAYGQTVVPPGVSLDNPTTNLAGVIGEVTLPYTVPFGQILTLTNWGIEGRRSDFAAIFPWVGATLTSNGQTLPTVTAFTATNQLLGTWALPANTLVNVRLVAGNQMVPGTVLGWWVQGSLRAV